MIEERFLFNFSKQEKDDLRAEYIRFQMLREKEDKYVPFKILVSSEYFSPQAPKPYSVLGVKYLINRIAGNDTSLSQLVLGAEDAFNGDEDALKLKNALQTNKYCHIFAFKNCNLTDEGAINILTALKNRTVSMLDLRGNKLTTKTLDFIVNELKTQEENNTYPKWNKILLGRVALDQKRINQMAAFPQLVFIRAVNKKETWFDKIFKNRSKIDFREKE